jgi:hypothetical protein
MSDRADEQATVLIDNLPSSLQTDHESQEPLDLGLRLILR